MNKTIYTTIILVCYLLLSCAPQLYIPAAKDATEQQTLLAGRNLYVSHCGHCHNLHLPKERDKDGWFKQLNKMQERAKITDSEKDLIYKYLTYQPIIVKHTK